jgi:hypothetical protein
MCGLVGSGLLRRVNLEVVVPEGVEAMLPCIEEHQLRLERDGKENGHDLPRARKAYSPYSPKKPKQIRSCRSPDAQYSSPKIRECGGSKDSQQSIVNPPIIVSAVCHTRKHRSIKIRNTTFESLAEPPTPNISQFSVLEWLAYA